ICELDGIADEIEQALTQSRRVGSDLLRDRCINGNSKFYPLLLGLRAHKGVEKVG
ncbi:unnamed protein product, partial [marine sediment metagenome]